MSKSRASDERPIRKGISLANTVYSEVTPRLPLPLLPVFCGQDLRLVDEQPVGSVNQSTRCYDVVDQAGKIAQLLQAADVSYLCMSSQRVEDDIDLKFKDYRDTYYEELRDGPFQVTVSEKFLKCPICPDSRDYGYNELLRHVKWIMNESKTTGFIEKAKHFGLIEYLETDFHFHFKFKCFDTTSANLTPNQNAKEEQFVWPWMAVVANIPAGKKLKDNWIEHGYSSVKVHPLLKPQGRHSGFAVVEFGKNWDGFFHVMMFMKAFEVNKHGRKDWYDREKGKGDELYAWLATYEDYNSYNLVGDHLRKNGDLKTIADVQNADEPVILGLKTMIGEMDKRTEEMNTKISKVDVQIDNVIKEKKKMTENFNRDKKMIQKDTHHQLKVIRTKHEQAKWLLEDREKGLKAREVLNDSERRKLDDEKKRVAVLDHNKADERVLKLAEGQKREIEKLNQKIIGLQKKLDEKQCLEQMRGALEVMKHMIDEHLEAKRKKESIRNVFKEKELWNKMEERRSSLKDGAEVVLDQWKTYKRHRRG